MSVEVWAMISAGVAALIVGIVLVRPRFQAASGAEKVIVLGPVFEAVSLTIFAAEHFTAARDLMPLVPHWLPAPLFWVYFVGACLLAAAISFIAWRHVRWSALLLALLFLIIVATIDLPNVPKGMHDRIFWTLTVREICFAGGAMVLAGSVWPRERPAGALMLIGRAIVGCVFIFYAIEHFLFSRNVPGVPLEKMIPAWWPAPTLLSYIVGITLLVTGIGLPIAQRARISAAIAGTVLVLLTIFFYIPVLVAQFHTTALAVEGINYAGDTLLFAATALLAGFGAARQEVREPVRSVKASLS
jgi:uncharacterized membrane protein